MKIVSHITLTILLLVLVSCAHKESSDTLLGSWQYTSQISAQQTTIIAENEERAIANNQEFSNYQLEITGEQVFAETGSYKNTSNVQIELSILIGAVQLNYQVEEEGNWSRQGDSITMVPTISKAQPADEFSRLFSVVNPDVEKLLESPKKGRTMRIVSEKDNSMQLEYDPEAKVRIDLSKKQ